MVWLVPSRASGADKQLDIIGGEDNLSFEARVSLSPHRISNLLKGSHTSLELPGEVSEHFCRRVFECLGYSQAQVSMLLLMKANINPGNLGCLDRKESIFNVSFTNLMFFNV